MAVRTPTIDRSQRYGVPVVVVTWTGLLNGDTGAPFAGIDFDLASVQIKGTFGVGGSINYEGSNDGGTTYGILGNQAGSAITKTAAAVEGNVVARALLMRPNVTAGDGSTNLTMIAVYSRTAR